jgi:hypothetical protein
VNCAPVTKGAVGVGPGLSLLLPGEESPEIRQVLRFCTKISVQRFQGPLISGDSSQMGGPTAVR